MTIKMARGKKKKVSDRCLGGGIKGQVIRFWGRS